MSELADIKARLAEGKPAVSMTVQRFLALFHQERRGYRVVHRIRHELKRHKLATEPDFANQHYYDTIRIVLAKEGATPVARAKPSRHAPSETKAETKDHELEQEVSETVHREPREAIVTIRQGIPAAGKSPATVRPEEPVMKALSRLMAEKLSLLIVQKGDRTRAEGLFSYESFSHAHMAGKQPKQVSDCMSRDFIEVNEEKPLIDAVRDIIQHGTVVVRSSHQQLCGVVTAKDVAPVFVELAEPFLLLAQIENHLRALLEKAKITKEEYKSLVVESDGDRKSKAEGPDDLTLGELIAGFEKEQIWKKVGLQFDKATFTQRMHAVRDIRNKVAHFSPDGLPPENVETLKDARELLEKL